jgi:microcystin-dependent protein
MSRVGEIFQFAGVTPPKNALLCDGREVSQALYPALYAVIGDAFATVAGVPAPGAGNFRVPPSIYDGEGIHMRPKTDAAVVGQGVLDENLAHVHTVTVNSGGSHSHTRSFNYHNNCDNGTGITSMYSGSSTHWSSYSGAHTHNLTLADDGLEMKARPEGIVTLRCIWAK